MGDDNCFKDQELKRSDGDSDSFNRLKETAIDASLRFIQERFQGMETDPVLLAAATLTTHQSWPVGNRNLLLLHGEHDIQVLVDHFKVPLQRNNFHLQHCLEEWMDMKFHVQRVRDELTLRQDVFWKNKFMLCRDRFPNLLMLIEICLVIPCQTACCERGNSCMSRIMTDWRCTLVHCRGIDEDINQWSLARGLSCCPGSRTLDGVRGEEQEANSNGLNKQTDAEFQKVKRLCSIFIFITFSNGGS